MYIYIHIDTYIYTQADMQIYIKYMCIHHFLIIICAWVCVCVCVYKGMCVQIRQ